MSGKRRYRVFKPIESLYIEDLVEIMKGGNGSFTQKRLWEKLSEKHPYLSHQQLKIEVRYALYYDRYLNDKNSRFCVVHQGAWILNKENESKIE